MNLEVCLYCNREFKKGDFQITIKEFASKPLNFCCEGCMYVWLKEYMNSPNLNKEKLDGM